MHVHHLHRVQANKNFFNIYNTQIKFSQSVKAVEKTRSNKNKT